MKASALSSLGLVFVAAAGLCAASPVDSYKSLATAPPYTPTKGYTGDLSLFALTPA